MFESYPGKTKHWVLVQNIPHDTYIHYLSRYAYRELSSQEMELVTQVQILDEAVYISLWTNTPRKDINPIIFPPDI